MKCLEILLPFIQHIHDVRNTNQKERMQKLAEIRQKSSTQFQQKEFEHLCQKHNSGAIDVARMVTALVADYLSYSNPCLKKETNKIFEQNSDAISYITDFQKRIPKMKKQEQIEAYEYLYVVVVELLGNLSCMLNLESRYIHARRKRETCRLEWQKRPIVLA